MLASSEFCPSRADSLGGMPAQRISFDYSDLVVGTGNTAVLERAISDLAQRFEMQWQLNYSGKLKRVALLVSKIDHCLYDILIRHRSGGASLHRKLLCRLNTGPGLHSLSALRCIRALSCSPQTALHILPFLDSTSTSETQNPY